jgi:hypothetical protein
MSFEDSIQSTALPKETAMTEEQGTRLATEKPATVEVHEGDRNELIKTVTERLKTAETLISEVEAMEVGSREKYDAAYRMRDEIMYGGIYGHIVDSLDLISVKTDLANTEAAQELATLKSKTVETKQDMMRVWWDARGQYEGNPSAEIADDYTKIIRGEVNYAQALTILVSENLDEGSKEYLATEIMRQMMGSGNYKDAVDIAAFARMKGFYKSMSIDSLTAELARSVKNDAGLFEKAKSLLGPNTQPYA